MLRDGLTPKQRKDFDETMADKTITNFAIRAGIKDEYGTTISISSIAQWRRGEVNP